MKPAPTASDRLRADPKPRSVQFDDGYFPRVCGGNVIDQCVESGFVHGFTDERRDGRGERCCALTRRAQRRTRRVSGCKGFKTDCHFAHAGVMAKIAERGVLFDQRQDRRDGWVALQDVFISLQHRLQG